MSLERGHSGFVGDRVFHAVMTTDTKLEWPSGGVPVSAETCSEICDDVVQSITHRLRTGDNTSVDSIKLMGNIEQWLVENYYAHHYCVSCKTRERIGRDHPDYRTASTSVAVTVWTTIAYMLQLESKCRPVLVDVTECSTDAFGKTALLFSVETLSPVVQSLLREWNRVDAQPKSLGKNQNAQSWPLARIQKLEMSCAVATVTPFVTRQLADWADVASMCRFLHLCTRLFYWIRLERLTIASCPELKETDLAAVTTRKDVESCRRSFYLWMMSQLQFDLERGKEFGEIFRRVIYGFELGAASLNEYSCMHPNKSDTAIRTMKPMTLFMETDADITGSMDETNTRYNTVKNALASKLVEIAKAPSHSLHQCLALSLMGYYFEQAQRKPFIGRYAYFHYHLDDIYRRRDQFFRTLAYKTPPREYRPRIVCTGSVTRILFKGTWIRVGGLVDACSAWLALCKRYHANELEDEQPLSTLFSSVTETIKM